MTLHRYAAELVIFGNATMVCPSRDLCDAAQQRFEELYPELIGKGHFIVLSEQRREGLP